MYTQTAFISIAILLANVVISVPAPMPSYSAGYNGTNTCISISSIAKPTSSQLSIATSSTINPTAAPSVTTTTLPSISNPAAGAPSNPANPETSASGLTLFQQLVLAPNAVDRLALLNDADFVFDFADKTRTAGVTKGEGGKIVRADHATFPALVGQGGAVAIGFLGPCGFNTPHVHPRAAELNLVIEGRLFASVTAENGVRHLNHTLNKYEMTVFPQGAIHTEFNPDCIDAVFVASFPSEDPGVGQIAQEFYGLENEIVKGSSGGEVTVDGRDIDAFRSKIPANVAKGVDSCLAKCGIKKR